MPRNDFINIDGTINYDNIASTSQVANISIKQYGAKGDGTTDDYLAFIKLISSIGSSNAEVYLPSGTYIIGTNLTIPSNISFIFANGAMLSPNTSITITINGYINSPMSQIFGGAGIITGTGSLKNKEVFPQWWGAKGDGITNDTTAINSAYTFAVKTNTQLTIPPRTYIFDGNLTIAVGISIEGLGAILNASASANSDCLILADGNYSNVFLHLPSIINFTLGTGLHLLGADLCDIEIENVANCKDGIVLETTPSQMTCLDNTIKFNTINNCTAGSAIKFKGNATNQMLQGNLIEGNFITNCLNGIMFDCPVSNAPSWDDVRVCVEAIEGSLLAGSRGIYGPNGLPPSRGVFQISTFFGGFISAYVEGNSNNCTYELAFDTNPGNLMKLTGIGNIIKSFSGNYSQTITTAPIIATTTSGSQATFFGGQLLSWNKTYIGFNVGALTAGQVADFYVYHAFTTGYSHMLKIIPHFSQPLAVMCIEDTSLKAGIDGYISPNQIHIRLVAITAITATRQDCTIEVGL